MSKLILGGNCTNQLMTLTNSCAPATPLISLGMAWREHCILFSPLFFFLILLFFFFFNPVFT